MPRRAARHQIADVVTGFAWTLPLSLGAFYAIHRVMDTRASEREQSLGLDVSEHEIAVYPDFTPTPTVTTVFGTTPAASTSPTGSARLSDPVPGGD